MDKQEIQALIDAQPARTALDQAFYTDDDVYQRDIEEVYLKSWLYAGHISEIPNVGDWFLFELAGESVIVVRSGNNEVSALVNVCRHRGSKICLEKKGCSRNLVCRYHGWSYSIKGELLAVRSPEDYRGLDRSCRGLKRLRCERYGKLVFYWRE